MSRSKAHKGKLKGLYAITDEKLITEQEFSEAVELALQGGARIIQYRDKSNDQKKRFQQAQFLQSLCTQYHATCIINDDIELARSIKADGVHLGKSDISLTEARQKLGEKIIIGVSCYDDMDIALEAEKNNADYVAFGVMFASKTKPDAVTTELDIISKAKQQLSIPLCTIGGITHRNIDQLIRQGTDMAAVINNLFATDDIKKAATILSQRFNQ